MGQLAALDQELQKKRTDLNTQIGGLEKNIILNAKSLYGKTVSENSFAYLLIVFAAVFFVIMIMPYFYPQPIAENVLKSEFLLQFSTVFVLVAAIIILAIGGFIARDQLPVLLAGISGYVLGQLGSNTGAAIPPGRLTLGWPVVARAPDTGGVVLARAVPARVGPSATKKAAAKEEAAAAENIRGQSRPQKTSLPGTYLAFDQHHEVWFGSKGAPTFLSLVR